MKQGRSANQSGNRLENTVESVIEQAGYRRVESITLGTPGRYSMPVYARQVTGGTTIYGKKRICDFVLFHPELFPDHLIVECKWQQSAGTVEEKFPFLVENIKLLGTKTIIILDGGGYSTGAREWLERQATPCQSDSPIIGVWSLSDFLARANKGELG